MEELETKMVAPNEIREFLSIFLREAPLGVDCIGEKEWVAAEKEFKKEFKVDFLGRYEVELKKLLTFINKFIAAIVNNMIIEGAARGDIELGWNDELNDFTVGGI